MGFNQSSSNNRNDISNNDLASVDALNRNQVLLHQEDQEANIVVGQPKIKNTLAIKNPSYLEKSSLALSRDSEKKNIYYIKFTYDSLVDFKLNLIFLAKEGKITDQSLFSSDRAENLSFDVEKGFRKVFFNKDCYINTSTLSNQLNKNGITDLVIELIPIIEHNDKIAFYTLCSITEEKITDETIIYKIKGNSQRLIAHGMMMEVNEIFNSMRESGECIICFEKNANTILLPCKHSCCSSCAHGLRMRNLGCPVCKQEVEDLLIIEITE